MQAQAEALSVELGRAWGEVGPFDWRDGRIHIHRQVAIDRLGDNAQRRVEAHFGDIDILKPVAFCPGFIRGLSFVDGYAVVTLSKPRYKRFDGLELASKLEEKDADPWCGVQIISLQDGSVAHWIRFDGAIQELFDVCVLPGVRDALTVAPHSAEFNNFVTFEDLVPALQKEDA